MIDLQKVKQRYGIVGNSPELNRSIDVALQIAPTDLSALIIGESGVGKEFFPQIIHQNSARKHGPYFAVNCGAIPEGTIDSELFGHEKGAFTGAVGERKGYFEVADGGTIFLDEIGEMPISTQARLLRVLEVGEFIRVGSSKPQKTNVRVVAATNVNLPKAIQTGKFREDLFYRLNTVPITIPPLRERADDMMLLFRKFVSDFAAKYRMPSIRLDDKATQVLRAYRWPGNVRELKNVAEGLSIMSGDRREITAEDVSAMLPNIEAGYFPILADRSQHEAGSSFSNEREILYQVLFDMRKDMMELKRLVNDMRRDNGEVVPAEADAPSSIMSLITIPKNEGRERPAKFREEAVDVVEEAVSLEEIERDVIKRTLMRHDNNRRLAAEELKISERTLYRKIKEYGLE